MVFSYADEQHRIVAAQAATQIPANPLTPIPVLTFFWQPKYDGLWSSPNAIHFRRPVTTAEDDRNARSLYNFFRRPHKTRWLDSTSPYLAFWPAQWIWTGTFSTLNVVPGNVRVNRFAKGPGYHLPPDVIQHWQGLEYNLLRLAQGLLALNNKTKYQMHHLQCKTVPQSCQYEGIHAHEAEVVQAAIQTSKAFVILSSFVSFAIALDLARNPHQEGATPHWITYGQSDLHITPTFLDEVSNSFIAIFSPGFRPGAYAEYRYLGMDCFDAFLTANAPLYIHWGEAAPQLLHDNSSMLKYCPTIDQAKRAREEYAQGQSRQNPRSVVRSVDVDNELGQPRAPSPPTMEDREYREYTASPEYPSALNALHALQDSPESPPQQVDEEDDWQDAPSAVTNGSTPRETLRPP